MKSKIKAIDLFSGGGGLSQGLANAGVEISAAFDNWDAAIEFYKKNINNHPIIKADLLNSEQAAKMLRDYEFNMIVGGPPCQDFSSAGKRDETGGRANLTISFAEIVESLLPKYFIMENVDRSQNTSTFKNALNIFKRAGYGLTTTVLDASLCGVPQKRKRVIVFGILNGPNNALIPLVTKFQSQKPTTIRDYLGEAFGLQYYYRHPRSYARRAVFSIDEPSPTVRGVNRPVPLGYPGHPGDATPISRDIRPLTTKERSLIQTFPASWDVSGKKSEIEQIIGNAVPVKLGEFIGRCILGYHEAPDLYSEFKVNSSGEYLLFEQRVTYASSIETFWNK